MVRRRFTVRAIGGPDQFVRPVSRPIIHTGRLDLQHRRAKLMALSCPAIDAGNARHGISPSMITVLTACKPSTAVLTTLTARNARPALSRSDPRAACSLA